jgi:hypothetical protein
VVKRQRGNHIILRRSDPPARVVVPDHKVLRVGTLRSMLNSAESLLKTCLSFFNGPRTIENCYGI